MKLDLKSSGETNITNIFEDIQQLINLESLEVEIFTEKSSILDLEFDMYEFPESLKSIKFFIEKE